MGNRFFEGNPPPPHGSGTTHQELSPAILLIVQLSSVLKVKLHQELEEARFCPDVGIQCKPHLDHLGNESKAVWTLSISGGFAKRREVSEGISA